MPETAPSADRLLVMRPPGTAVIRVVGRGSFKNSTALKEFAGGALDEGARTVLLDVSACAGLDSTFMGVLAGLALRLRRAGEGQVVVVNADAKLARLLETLGLHLLVSIHGPTATPVPFAELLAAEAGLAALSESATQRGRTAETMLEAHEQLVEASPENLPRFRDVLEYLREDVRSRAADGGGAEA
jgi:anti-sigma B factor antagonist